MLLLIAGLVLAVAFVVMLVIGARRGSWGGTAEIPAAQSADAAAAIRGARMRMFISLGIFVVVAALVTIDPFGLQPVGWFGVGQALGPGIAAILALTTLALSPSRGWRSDSRLRSAELTPRRASSFGPRWGFALPLASAALLIVFLVIAGATSSTDSIGRARMISLTVVGVQPNITQWMTTDPTQRTVSGTSGPYPGWFYGVPLIAVTVVLALVVLATLRRLASARRPVGTSLYALDDALRRDLTRFVMLLGSTALLLYFAAVISAAGIATSNVATNIWQDLIPMMPVHENTSFALTRTYQQPLFGIGVAESILGVVFGIVALVLLAATIAAATVSWVPSARRVVAEQAAS